MGRKMWLFLILNKSYAESIMNIPISYAKLRLLCKSVIEHKRLYFRTAALIIILLQPAVEAAENDVPLSTLPEPILQRIEYEFGDTSSVRQIKIYPSPKIKSRTMIDLPVDEGRYKSRLSFVRSW